MILPRSIAIGDLIAYANENTNEKATTREGRMDRYTFAGAEYFKRMKEVGLYTTNINEVEIRIKKLNLDGAFNKDTQLQSLNN